MVFNFLCLDDINLQLFGGEGGAGSAGGAAGDGGGDGAQGAASVEAAPADGEARLRELGVPESVLAKRAKRNGAKASAQAEPAKQTQKPSAQQAAPATNQTTPEGSNAEDAKPARMSWEDIMADPEYNKQMQQTIQARLKTAKGAEENLSKLQPAMELLARRYGLDANNLDPDALTKAISDDNSYYEDKALELGVPVETAKLIDQNEREAERRKAEEAKSMQQKMIEQHLAKLQQQGEQLKTVFPKFNLAQELKNPVFARMTAPGVGLSVEDAYYAVHRNEIQQASMQATAKKTAVQMSNAIRSGQSRPVENGTQAQSPSVTNFDYAHASKEQREALKKRIREASARGQKIYPGQ